MNRWTTPRAPLAALLVLALILIGAWRTALPAQAAAGITASPSTVQQGSQLHVTGNGFTPSDTVVVYFDATVNNKTQRVQTSTTSDGNGAFSTRLTVPRDTFPQEYTLFAKDTHGVTASRSIGIRALLVLRTSGGNPSETVLAEHQVVVDALGFSPHETVTLHLTFPNYSGNDVVSNRTPAANADGNVFGQVFTVPAGTKVGWSSVSATGQTSKKSAQGLLYVTYHPTVFLRSSTVQAGGYAVVEGRAFVANATVHVQITINTSNGSQTLSVAANTNQAGNFTKYVRIPSYTSAGTYSVAAADQQSGIKRFAHVTVYIKTRPKPTATSTPKPRPTATPTQTPHYNGQVQVYPHTTLPNQDVAVVGSGYPGNVAVTITATVNLRDGSTRDLHKVVYTDNTGHFSISLRIPYKTDKGSYSINASGGGQSSDASLRVLSLGAKPANLNFQWISLWYHTVRQGTYDVITIQSTLHIELGIWTHVIFPNGQRYDYYKGTDTNGQWSVKFKVPKHAATSKSNQVYITLQLWHGQRTTQGFISFTLV